MPVRIALYLLLCMALALPARAQDGATPPQLRLVVFWSVDCPVCLRQKPWLDALAAAHPDLVVEAHELSSAAARARFEAMAAVHGIPPAHVPTLFLDGRVWVGDTQAIRAEIAAAVAGGTGPPEAPVRLPLGLDAATAPILALTLAIAFVDGFNPCSLWVLTLLLGLVVNSGSRRRILLVGITFLATTATLYGAFIAGVFGLMQFVAHLDWLRWAVAALALAVGLINVKDFLWSRAGVSLSIPEARKPAIYRGLRGLGTRPLSTPALIGTTLAMAAGIALVELPCTAGFPVLWSGLITDRGIAGAQFWALLGAYVLVYLSIELAVFLAAIVTLRMGRLTEAGGRLLKLYGGTIMIALALALVLRPGLMHDLGGTLVLFLAAGAVAGLLHLAGRHRLPGPRP